jgi:hypothetical protein
VACLEKQHARNDTERFGYSETLQWFKALREFCFVTAVHAFYRLELFSETEKSACLSYRDNASAALPMNVIVFLDNWHKKLNK